MIIKLSQTSFDRMNNELTPNHRDRNGYGEIIPRVVVENKYRGIRWTMFSKIIKRDFDEVRGAVSPPSDHVDYRNESVQLSITANPCNNYRIDRETNNAFRCDRLELYPCTEFELLLV